MTKYLLILVAVAALLIGFAIAKAKAKRKDEDKESLHSYQQKEVMTDTERRLYFTLAAAIGEDFLLLAQVQLSSFIQPIKGGYAGMNKINKKSVDFLLCDKNGKVATAIELQDKTHNRRDRQESDTVKAAALKSAGVPLIEFHAKKMPTVTEVSEQIRRFRS